LRKSWIPWILGPLTAGLAFAFFASGRAGAEEARHRVTFSVAQERQVENDRATAILSLTAEDADPAVLASKINEGMGWALGLARKSPGVTPRSGGYRTWPILKQQRVHHWRATQELVLASGDTAALSALVGKLQTRLPLTSLRFSVSPERRRATEDGLIRKALEAAKARAELVRQGLGAKRYEWIELGIHTGSTTPPPLPLRAMAVTEAVGTAPSLQAGSSEVRVTLNASIELD